MFDNEINFVLQPAKNKKPVRSPVPKTSQTPYTKPKQLMPQEQESKKTSPFKKIGGFFGNLFKSRKNKKKLPKQAGQPLEKTTVSQSQKPGDFPKQVSKLGGLKISSEKKSSFFTAPSIPQPTPSAQDKKAQVNLMPDDVAVSIEFKKKFSILGLSAVIAGLILGLAFLGVYIYGRSFTGDTTSAQQDLLAVGKEINTYQEHLQESRVLTQKIDLVLDLIKGHKYWSSLFPVLEGLTHADVLYSDFLGDATGQISLDSIAPNFEVVAQQVLILKDQADIIEDFDISDIGLRESKSSGSSVSNVGFNLTLKFKPDTFLKK